MTATITLRKLSKPNCRPCAVITNYLGVIADNLAALNVQLVEHDVVAEPDIAAKYGLTSVPVLIVERDGIERARVNGIVAPAEILETVQAVKEAYKPWDIK